jgi:nitrous oxide reductase accessory protein NosL
MALLVSACTQAPATGPVPIHLDRDRCKGCGMVISEREFAAEVRGGPRSEVFTFDDLGCALKWLDAQPFAADPTVQVWVARHADGQWLDAKAARFVKGATTPMGYGFAAVDPEKPGQTLADAWIEVRAHAARQH